MLLCWALWEGVASVQAPDLGRGSGCVCVSGHRFVHCPSRHRPEASEDPRLPLRCCKDSIAGYMKNHMPMMVPQGMLAIESPSPSVAQSFLGLPARLLPGQKNQNNLHKNEPKTHQRRVCNGLNLQASGL